MAPFSCLKSNIVSITIDFLVLVIWHPLSRQESDQKKNKLKLSYFSETRLGQGGLLGSQKWKIIEKDVLNVYGHIMLIFMALLERL
jgi:hypothetical protein